MDSEDLRFALPDLDATAAAEVGVMLLGQSTQQLLAGLGVAALADDPAGVTLLVDQLRHGVSPIPSVPAAVTAGARCWRTHRTELEAASARPVSGAPRQAWLQAVAVVQATVAGETGPATRAYLAACWLRRNEVDSTVEEIDAVSEITP